jgi:hypothetical protein
MSILGKLKKRPNFKAIHAQRQLALSDLQQEIRQGGNVDRPRILTRRLNRFGGNRLVLAKKYGYGNDDGIMAITYANITQAQRKVDQLKAQGYECYVSGDRPFYVTFDKDPNEGEE